MTLLYGRCMYFQKRCFIDSNSQFLPFSNVIVHPALTGAYDVPGSVLYAGGTKMDETLLLSGSLQCGEDDR